MFEKVVFLGKGGLTLDGLLREFGAVRAEAPNVVLIYIGMNDLCNGCVAEELAEGLTCSDLPYSNTDTKIQWPFFSSRQF